MEYKGNNKAVGSLDTSKTDCTEKHAFLREHISSIAEYWYLVSFCNFDLFYYDLNTCSTYIFFILYLYLELHYDYAIGLISKRKLCMY